MWPSGPTCIRPSGPTDTIYYISGGTALTDQFDLFPGASLGAQGRPSAPAASPSLNTYQSSAEIMPFPLSARIGKVRDVAGKLLACKSSQHARVYRAQVTEALGVHFRSKRVPTELHAGEIHKFWSAVELEVARRLHHGRLPGGLG